MAQISGVGIEARMDPRIGSADAWIDIEGRTYRIGDVSISGVLVTPYEGGHEVGGSFSFQLHLRESGQEVVIEGGAVVVRLSGSEMAAQFFYLDSEQYPAFDDYLERQFRAKTAH